MVGAAATAVTIAIFLVAMATAFAFVAFFAALAFMVFAVVTTAAAVMFKRLEVFFCCFTDGDNFDSKVEILASKFVVCIDDSRLFANRLDS